MPDVCRVIPAVKSDRAGQPGVELRGDGLYGVYVSSACLLLLFVTWIMFTVLTSSGNFFCSLVEGVLD